MARMSGGCMSVIRRMPLASWPWRLPTIPPGGREWRARRKFWRNGNFLRRRLLARCWQGCPNEWIVQRGGGGMNPIRSRGFARWPGRGWFWLLLLLFFMAAALVFSGIGSWLAAPASSPVKADVVVILGGDGGVGRTITAGELIRGGYAPQALLTGNCTAGRRAAQDRFREMRLTFLPTWGWQARFCSSINGRAIPGRQAINTRRLMEEKGWKRVMVVSDPPHLRRLDLAWGPRLLEVRASTVLVAASAEWWHPEVWWSDARAAKLVLREALGYAYYAVRALTDSEWPA